MCAHMHTVCIYIYMYMYISYKQKYLQIHTGLSNYPEYFEVHLKPAIAKPGTFLL